MSEYVVKVEGQIPDAIYERQLEEVVRCRDCFHYEDGENNCGVPRQCIASGYLLENGDGFCAWGERGDE